MSAAYLDALARFADFDGRTSRADYWGFVIIHSAISGVLVLGSAIAGETFGLGWLVGGAVAAMYLTFTFFPALSSTARRLHDVGRSSLWVGLGLVPPLGLVLLWWLARPGDPAPNAWGQPGDGGSTDG